MKRRKLHPWCQCFATQLFSPLFLLLFLFIFLHTVWKWRCYDTSWRKKGIHYFPLKSSHTLNVILKKTLINCVTELYTDFTQDVSLCLAHSLRCQTFFPKYELSLLQSTVLKNNQHRSPAFNKRNLVRNWLSVWENYTSLLQNLKPNLCTEKGLQYFMLMSVILKTIKYSRSEHKSKPLNILSSFYLAEK